MRNVLVIALLLSFSLVIARPSSSNCDQCLPGWGVVSLCNSTHPTVCQPCGLGTWSPRHPHLNRCRSCSKCGDGLYVYRQCTPSHDTRCGSCASNKGRFTTDFVRKCLERQDVPEQQQSAALKMFFDEVKRSRDQQLVPNDGDQHHQFWKFTTDSVDDPQPDVKVKPSYHEYHMRRVLLAAHRRKALVLLALTAMVLLTTMVFVVCFVRTHCVAREPRVLAGRSHLYVHLTENDDQLIRECAQRLRRDGKTRLDSVCNEPEEWWEEPMTVRENPLEQYLHSSQEQLIPRAK